MIESNPYRRALKESRSKFHFVLQFNFIIFDYFQKKNAGRIEKISGNLKESSQRSWV